MYAMYHDCDPLLAGRIARRDQVTRLISICIFTLSKLYAIQPKMSIIKYVFYGVESSLLLYLV